MPGGRIVQYARQKISRSCLGSVIGLNVGDPQKEPYAQQLTSVDARSSRTVARPNHSLRIIRARYGKFP